MDRGTIEIICIDCGFNYTKKRDRIMLEFERRDGKEVFCFSTICPNCDSQDCLEFKVDGETVIGL